SAPWWMLSSTEFFNARAQSLPMTRHLLLWTVPVLIGTVFLPTTAPAAETDLIAPDAARYFAQPDFSSPVLSPDGANIAFIARQNGHARLFRLNLATGKVAGIFDPGEGEVVSFWWMGSQSVLIAGRGASSYAYFVQNITEGSPHTLSLLDGVQPQWITSLPKDPDHIVAIKGSYVERIDVRTNRSQMMEPDVLNPNSIVVSASGEVVAKASQEDRSWWVRWRPNGSAAWQQAKGSDDEAPYWPWGMARKAGAILVLAHDQGNTTALMTLDTDTGKRTLLAQRPDRDVYSLVFSAASHAPIGVTFFHPGQEDIQLFEPADQELQGRLEKSMSERFKRITSSSADRRLHVITAADPGQPENYYLLDLSHGRLSKLGQLFAADSLPPLGHVRFFDYTTRDGVRESGYILLPASGNGPFPALLVPNQYAGEFGRQSDGYDALEQFLSHRGIAVARLVVRGSRGLGLAFRTAGDYRLAETVAHDYEDGLAYLAKEGLVDSNRVGIFGEDRGALLALRMASTTHVFKTVVAKDVSTRDLSLTGVDLLTSSTGPISALIERAGGDAAASRLMRDFDPENFIAGLSAHALIIYTSDYDLEYWPTEAGRLRTSLQRHQKPHEWYLFDLHSYDRYPESHFQAIFATKVGAYLEQQLGVTPPPSRRDGDKSSHCPGGCCFITAEFY
ncbi:MAG: prolyl oligopeptidase family serine peptidase, partial [Opitutales bacterium]